MAERGETPPEHGMMVEELTEGLKEGRNIYFKT
jgi:hypothetical protein